MAKKKYDGNALLTLGPWFRQQELARGSVTFEFSVRTDFEAMRGWTPEQIHAFMEGIAKVTVAGRKKIEPGPDHHPGTDAQERHADSGTNDSALTAPTQTV